MVGIPLCIQRRYHIADAGMFTQPDEALGGAITRLFHGYQPGNRFPPRDNRNRRAFLNPVEVPWQVSPQFGDFDLFHGMFSIYTDKVYSRDPEELT